jgi:hypothetical protein
MDYIKKTVVLKEINQGFSFSVKPVSGIFRFESENGVSRLFLTVVNLRTTSNGEYFCLFFDCNNNLSEFSLGTKPSSYFATLDNSPNLSSGFSVAIVHLEDYDYQIVALANCDGKVFTPSDLRKVLDKKSALLKKQRKKDELLEREPSDSFTQYNDEAVATENYFDLDDSINQKLKTIEVKQNENLIDEDVDHDIKVQEETKEESDCFKGFEDALLESPVGAYTEATPYYLEAEREIKEIFLKFPKEQVLEKTFTNSEWARINYSESKYYVVGIIKEKDKPKYLCYGVPSEYSLEPPKELKDYCSFIPLSPLERKGDGYWMMFQDAITGDCIKKPDNE